MVDGSAHGPSLLGTSPEGLQQQQALAAHLQLQQQTSSAAVAAAEFPTVSFAQGSGSGDGAYQSPFLMGAPPAQADRHTAMDAAMPPTSDPGTIHVSL
jgi:hypothetical protein